MVQDDTWHVKITCHQRLVHADMAASVRAHEAVSPLSPVDGCHISPLAADLAELLGEGGCAVAGELHLAQQPQHIPAQRLQMYRVHHRPRTAPLRHAVLSAYVARLLHIVIATAVKEVSTICLVTRSPHMPECSPGRC